MSLSINELRGIAPGHGNAELHHGLARPWRPGVRRAVGMFLIRFVFATASTFSLALLLWGMVMAPPKKKQERPFFSFDRTLTPDTSAEF